ncbi:MAG: hypothetical protein ACO1OB_33500 [Archangium sp.]
MRSLLLVLFASCAPNIELSTDRTAYAVGETIEFTLRNRGLEAVRYNLCSVAFSPAIEEPTRVCAANAEGLPSGRWVSTSKDIPSNANAGNYVLEISLESVSSGERFTVESSPFEIRP